MKKLLPVLFVIFLVLSLSVSNVSAYADELTPDYVIEDSIYGVDLGDFEVELRYDNYILNSSGLYRAFEITFDKEFVDNNNLSDTEFLMPIAVIISSMGYVTTIDNENYMIVGEMEFDSLTDLYIAQGIDGYSVDSSSYVTQTSFFYTDTFIKTTSLYDGIEESDGVLNQIITQFYELGVSREAILLNYTYGTPYKIISTDADKQTYSITDKIYLHSFDMTMDTSDREINMVQHSPNQVGWYSLGAMIAVVVISVPLTIVIIKRKKKKGEANNG
jgi:hypothetical protein